MGILGLVSLGSRLGVAAASLYGSHQLGLWGDAKQGEEVYHQLQSGQLKDKLLADCPVSDYLPDLPDTGLAAQLGSVSQSVGETRANFWSYYNSAVLATTQGIIDIPHTARLYVNQAVEAVQENMK